MERLKTCPVLEFDHHSQRFADDLEGIVGEVRRSAPIFYTESNGGHYVVTSHALVKEILSDPKIFSSARTPDGDGGLFIPSWPLPFPGASLLPAELDPPEHTVIRRVINRWFTKTATERIGPRAQEIAVSAIDRVMEMGDFDVVVDIGHIVGPTLTMEYVGFPGEHRDVVMKAVRTGYQRKPGEDPLEDLLPAGMMIFDCINQRRENPTGDIVSQLVQMTEPELDPIQLGCLILTVLAAGFETTESLVANSMWYLYHHPDVRAELVKDPTLIPGAIDELLRFITPETTTSRNVTAETELGGVKLLPGDRVLVLITAGNHDDLIFENPDEIDIRRDCSQSLVFGAGPHHCPGSWLSKMEVQMILEQVMARMPEYVIHAERSQRFQDRAAANGWLTMPAATNA